MIEDLYPYLILVGVTIGVVLLYLWRQSRRVDRISLELIRLNEQHNFDVLLFLRDAWPLLAQAGLRGMAWRLDWFGMPAESANGATDGRCLAREITVGEMRLAIRLYQEGLRGERRYFNETLIETFLLLLRTDMWIKAGATNATFAQMAKLNLFLQHDMKNIAQFIQLMTDQLASVPAGREAQVLAHLRSAVPLMRDRADRVVRTLVAGSTGAERTKTLQLRDKLEQLCRLHNLDHVIAGSATLQAMESALDNALDNILKNYADLGARNGVRPLVSIEISTASPVVEIRIHAANVPAPDTIERLFEPFWSSDASGLGIGLYQARQLIENSGGSLGACRIEGEVLQFRVSLSQQTG
jgi:signal transduction histidine kinase